MESAGRLGPREELKAMTWVREILLFAAGITLFLFGMMRLSEEVQQYLSNVRIRQFFRLAVERPLYGLATGIVTTVLFQSSTATSVLVVGMVSAGLMSFNRSQAIIHGDDVGTTLTDQLVVWKVTEISPLIVFCGGMLGSSGSSGGRRSARGFSISGSSSSASSWSRCTAPFKESMALRGLFQGANHPLLGLAIGVIAASLIHSSAIPITILVILAQNGVISLDHALPIVFGANIGTAITALIASLVANINGKRTALAHFLFKLIGAVLCMTALPLFLRLLVHLSPEVAQQIAYGHLLFNVSSWPSSFSSCSPSPTSWRRSFPQGRDAAHLARVLDEKCLQDRMRPSRGSGRNAAADVLVRRMCASSINLISHFGEGRAGTSATSSSSWTTSWN